MLFKSVSETLENYYCGCTKYESVCHEPQKNQIKADAMVYIIRFIDWCFKREKNKF